jgi:hypothetical protein
MIKAILSAALVLALGGSAVANSVPLRMVVADLPYARVWAAAQDAVRDYPLERVADGEIVTDGGIGQRGPKRGPSSASRSASSFGWRRSVSGSRGSRPPWRCVGGGTASGSSSR